MTEPVGELDPRFSSPGASATTWAAASELVGSAMTYWLTTVRSDGRPHVVTVGGVWLGEIFHFTTGSGEQKVINLASGNTHVVVTTGCNEWDGLDVILEGEAVLVTAVDRLARMAAALTAKYDDFYRLRMVNGRLAWADNAEQAIEGRKDSESQERPMAYEVRPIKAFALGKGSEFSQTRWRFAPAAKVT